MIGWGGAGLDAAIEIKKAGRKVLVLGKRNKFDVHSSLPAGGINSTFGNTNKSDFPDSRKIFNCIFEVILENGKVIIKK